MARTAALIACKAIAPNRKPNTRHSCWFRALRTFGVGAAVAVGGGGTVGTGGSAVWMDSAHTSGWSSTGVKLITMLEAVAATWQARS